MDLVPVAAGERGSLTTGVRWTVRPRAESDGSYGRLEAINLETKETVWIARQRAPQTTGALVTAGGCLHHVKIDLTTLPSTSVSRKSRPWYRKFSRL